jgi:hypothetical protein
MTFDWHLQYDTRNVLLKAINYCNYVVNLLYYNLFFKN